GPLLVAVGVFVYRAARPRPLHSFPTRRSSDLSCWPTRPTPWPCARPCRRSVPVASTSPSSASTHPGARVQPCWPPPTAAPSSSRSEEHTSELQSRENLVCRLLLEKKK